MPFFVELPADRYGNRGYTNSVPCIIEADTEKDDHLGEVLLVKAPTQIRNKWTRIPRHQYGGWIDCDGPARILTWEEREVLIRNLQTKQGKRAQ